MDNEAPVAGGVVAGQRTKVEIFDPPMCCPTGLCGPTIDPVLLDVNEMVLRLKASGVDVVRYQLGAQPKEFMANQDVYQLLKKEGLSVLPITTVNGKVIRTGEYPSWEEVRQAMDGLGVKSGLETAN